MASIFGFDENSMRRIEAAVLAVEGRPPEKPLLRRRSISGVVPRIRYGKPTEAYTSGATITLDPCDIAGTDNGLANETVQAGWTLPANTNIPTTAIVPFIRATATTQHVIGVPREVVTNLYYNTTTHKLQKKVRYDFGVFSTTESSSWVDITTAVDCTA